MSEQIIKLAQADDQIINNLVNTENKLNDLNQEVAVILNDYQTVNKSEISFFNFDNTFFIATLVALFILAIALWFLQQELKHSRPTKAKKEKHAKHSKPEIKILPKIREEALEKSNHKKVRKIEVIKIK